jgi:hypothetical protein
MQLSDLRKPFEEMTDEELREHYRELRRRRDTFKPKEEKKKASSRKESLAAMMKKLQNTAGMSADEIKTLITQIERKIADEKQAAAR